MAAKCPAMSRRQHAVQTSEVPSETDFIIGTVFLDLRRLHLIQRGSGQYALSQCAAVAEMKLGIGEKIIDRCRDAASGCVYRQTEVVNDLSLAGLSALAMRHREPI